MNGSLDTNTILSLVIEEREEQREKVTELLDNNVCYIPDLVFPELEYVLTAVYKFPRKQVADSIHVLIAYKNTRCNVAMILEALDIYVFNPALSFVDCCLAVDAVLSKRKPLYTFDKKLALRSGGYAQLL